MGCFLFLTEFNSFAGCAGDCFTCHEKIREDKTHSSLGTCISCHNPKERKVNIFSVSDSEGCGNNCFQCHKEWPKNGYHAPLEKCRDCHKMPEKL